MSRSLPRCPRCGRKVPESPPSAWQPFCSERCRLLDLGAWLDGRHALPGEPAGPPSDPESPEESA